MDIQITTGKPPAKRRIRIDRLTYINGYELGVKARTEQHPTQLARVLAKMKTPKDDFDNGFIAGANGEPSRYGDKG